MKRLFCSFALVALAVGLASAGSASGRIGLGPTRTGPSVLRIQSETIHHATSNPCAANFGCNPPLIWHNGPVMGTATTGPLVVTPIYWQPTGHGMNKKYTTIITQYLHDVAHDSGQTTNVFSAVNEYAGSNGQSTYQVKLGKPIMDKGPLPTTNTCTVGPLDTSGIYKDGSGYDACVSDANIQAETERIITLKNLPVDFAHIYVLYLPKHVESCFAPGDSTDPNTNACTLNHYPTAAYCAYHFITQDATSAVYANMPYPAYESGTGYTCGSNSQANFGVTESPNKFPDADVEISPTSHEIIEAYTDPDTNGGWYDANGLEIGDECAYVYGPTAGTLGHLWNQTINHHHYLTQEEFSNLDFAATGRGCMPAVPPRATS